MKNQLLNLKMIALMCLMMVLGGANVWAEQYKIVFAKNPEASNYLPSISKSTSISDVISSGANYVSSFGTLTKAYYNSKEGIKLGSNNKTSGSGTFELKIDNAYQKNIKKLTIKSVVYDSSDATTLQVYSGSTSLEKNIPLGEDFVYTFKTPTTVPSVKIVTSPKRAYISEIILETEEANNPTLKASESALDFGAVENNTSKNLTFKLSGSKLTADATLSVDGEYFTVTPTSVAQTDGTIEETDVTVSYNPTAVGSHTATLTISSTGAEDKTITLKGTSANAYTVAWNVNGNVYTDGTPTTKVFEDEKVTVLPTAPADINGKVFVGWTNASLSAPQDVAPSGLFTDAADAPTVKGDVTYYAVFADSKYSGATAEKLTQTLNYDTWTYSGTSTDKTKYRLFAKDSYVESADFDLSILSKVVVYGGTYGGKKYNKLTIGDGVNIWREVTVTGSSEDGVNTYENGTPLSGNGKLRVISNVGDGSNNGVRISKIEIYTNQPVVTYYGYCTTVGATYTPAKVNFVAHAGDYYATFSNANVVFMPKDVTISAVTVDNNNVVMWKSTEGVLGKEETVYIDGTDVAGYYIPANTGVLLNSQKGGEVTYYTVENKEVAAYSADLDNMLMPSVAGGEFTAEPGKVYYKLAYNDYKAQTGLGFYWGADNGGAFSVKAGTAYLAVPASKAGAKGFAFNGEATGIEGVNANVENAKAIYNLNGQRVASMAKPGLYIVNGKKVVRK